MASNSELTDSRPCPLTGSPGRIIRIRTGAELVAEYRRYFGLALPEALRSAYFDQDFAEYCSTRSGLHWFSPPVCAGPEFYEYLGHELPWYYSPKTWDKEHALHVLRRLGSRSLFEAGCGNGGLLRQAQAEGLHVAGSEINATPGALARTSGLAVFAPDSIPTDCPADALVMIQVLEHIVNPLGFVVDLLRRIRPRHLLVAVPAHDTLLGRTTDPLVWPPHHVTLWSAGALAALAARLSGRLIEVSYEPLTWDRFRAVAGVQAGGRLAGLPSSRHPRRLALAYRLGRLMRCAWARRAHTVFGVIAFGS